MAITTDVFFFFKQKTAYDISACLVGSEMFITDRSHIVQSVGKEVEYGMEQSEFCKRLVELRMNKGVSARDMSLSIGQSPGYINNIENGVNFPSMTAFFFICDYLNITPKEFFDTETSAPTKAHELMEAIKGLNVEQLDSLIAIAKNLRRWWFDIATEKIE